MPAFFDKVGGLAKNLGSKASDSIETTKLNGKIKAEKTAITELQQKIGEYYFQLHEAGQEADPNTAEWLAAIDGHNAAVAELQAEIARIQAEAAQPVPAAAVPGAVYAAPIPEANYGAAQGAFCAACGHENPAGTKFCGGCGAKLEAEEPAPRICACGATVPPGIKFCGECGAKFE